MSAATVPVTRILVVELLHADESLYSSASKSMKAEGRAMLLAMTADLAAWPHSEVTVAIAADAVEDCSTLGEFVTRSICKNVAAFVEELAGGDKTFDVVFCIAPEGDRGLQATVNCLKTVAGRIICVGDELIQLGGDKLAFHDWCEANRIPTIPVLRSSKYETWAVCKTDFVVAKNRFGAGCEGIQRYRWGPKTKEIVQASSEHVTVWQPFVNGRFYSVGIIGTGTKSQPVVLPVAAQDILWRDNIPEYQGGQIPAKLKLNQQRQLSELLLKIVSLLKIDDGYVGLDFVWCNEDRSEQNLQSHDLQSHDLVDGDVNDKKAEAEFAQTKGGWQVVELNPRLCTSYLGYRKVFAENLAELWWNSELKLSSIDSHKTRCFDARSP